MNEWYIERIKNKTFPYSLNFFFGFLSFIHMLNRNVLAVVQLKGGLNLKKKFKAIISYDVNKKKRKDENKRVSDCKYDGGIANKREISCKKKTKQALHKKKYYQLNFHSFFVRVEFNLVD